jgi:hypothetical protein
MPSYARINNSTGHSLLVPSVNDLMTDLSVVRTKIRRNKLIEKRFEDRVKDQLSSVVYMQNYVAVAVTRLQQSNAGPLTNASTPGGDEASPTKVQRESVLSAANLLALSNTKVRPGGGRLTSLK